MISEEDAIDMFRFLRLMDSSTDPFLMREVFAHLSRYAFIDCCHSMCDSDNSYNIGYTEHKEAGALAHRNKFCYKCVNDADKMARQLIEEEKNEKKELLNEERKKEKKRLKKQRQKQKRKGISDEGQETQEDDIPIKAEEEEEIDMNAAFLNRAVEKLNISKQTVTEKPNKKITVLESNSNKEHPVTPLAFEAFNCATEGNFHSAIDKYSEAMKVSPEDFRLYVNRSLCFLQIKEYKKALEDAILCVNYAPDYGRGYLRKGEAYLGLEEYNLAEEAFEEVLKYDPQCQEAANDLMFLKIRRLMELGYSKEQASFAMRSHKTVEDAVQFLLDNPDCCQSSVVEKPYSQDDEVFNSDTDEDESDASSMISSAAISSHASVWDIYDYKTDPYTDVTNPYKCCDLYVGNLSFEISQNILKSYFERYGKITSFKLMKNSNSALISYDNWKSASDAMSSLQNTALLPRSPKIIIKYPGTKVSNFIRSDINLNGTQRDKMKVTDKNFCSQTMPPPSPTPSLSSMKSSRTEYEDYFSKLRTPKINPTQDPSNPTNCCSLYVGKIASRIKERNLLDSFSKYGKIASLRIISDSKCAFINFENGRSAGNAMRWLQNKSLLPGTPPVTIKYPSKAISTQKSNSPSDKPLACYRWRIAGFCELGKKCPFPHNLDQKGIAMTHKAVKAVATRRK